MAKNKEHSARSKGDRRLCFERAERLALQAARARTRSSSSAFAGECAELLTESRELGTAARLRGGTGGDSPCFAFLLQAFSFSNKKKMPKRGKCEKFDYSGTRR